MPRSGTGVYTQPFPEVEEDTTIESSVYNGFTADVALDLNWPRPILSGGTGGTNAAEAMTNLNGETAKQLVTNYDSHPFLPGSFYSQTSASGSPVAGHAFIGTVTVIDASNMVLEARDQTTTTNPGKVWVRERKSGTWSAWVTDAPDKVDVGGAVMTGPLAINADNPFLLLDKKASGQNAYVAGSLNSKNRWAVMLGDSAVEGAEGVGSDFRVYRYNNAGTPVDTPITVSRLNGDVTINGELTKNKVNRAGDSMSGALNTVAPTADTHAANKTYVDHAPRILQLNSTVVHTYLNATHVGTIQAIANAAASYFIVQTQVAAPMPISMGSQIDLINWGCPDCRVYASPGVSLYSEDQRFRLRTTWSTATLVHLGSDSWLVTGSLIP